MTYSVPLVAGGSGAQSVQLFGQIPANQIPPPAPTAAPSAAPTWC